MKSLIKNILYTVSGTATIVIINKWLFTNGSGISHDILKVAVTPLVEEVIKYLMGGIPTLLFSIYENIIYMVHFDANIISRLLITTPMHLLTYNISRTNKKNIIIAYIVHALFNFVCELNCVNIYLLGITVNMLLIIVLIKNKIKGV